MICPMCKFPRVKIHDTIKLLNSVKRIRQCLNPDCEKFFITNETVMDKAIFDEKPNTMANEKEESEDQNKDESNGQEDLFTQNQIKN